MRKKPFEREKAKKDLENIIIEKIKEHYLKENQKVKEKNDMSKKSDMDVLPIDELLKKMGQIPPLLESVAKLIQSAPKIKPPQKADITKILGTLHQTFLEFTDKKKNFPIKPNDWVKRTIEETYTSIKDIERHIGLMNNSGCCSAANQIKSFENNIQRLKEINFFWLGLGKSEAREGYQEVHIVPVFSENELRRDLRGYLEDHFPHEQEPQIIKQEIIKRVETDVIKPDHLRLAHELLFGFGRPQDIIAALKIYHQEADKNIQKSSEINVCACNSLGKIYLEGKFVPKDLKKALFYFEKSLMKDENEKDPEALYQIGLMEEKGLIKDGGKSREENRENAKQYFIAAAEKGHKDAITDLGFMAHEEQDYKAAVEYYTIAKKAKHPRALNNLGKLYMENLASEKVKDDNYRKAIKYFELASEFGNIKAIYNLGVCYEKGIGVEQNLEKAYSLFKEAARKGDLEGKLFYSSHVLRNALGTNKDEDFIEAANMLHEVIAEDPEKEAAYFYLGYLYEYGFGVGKDYKVALNYYYKSAELNYPPALNKLGNFFYSGYGVERIDMEKAIEFYEKAAQLNDADALINLGVLLENGNEYIQKDVEKALECFKKASNELGDPRGFLNIGHIFSEGNHVEKNMDKAIEYYSKAASLGDKLAKEILSAKGKTHLQSTYIEEKELLKKSQIGKFCEENLIKSSRNDPKDRAIPAVKKNKENKSAYINSIVASGLAKEFVQKTNFNPQDFDFYKNEGNFYNNDYGNNSERNELNLSHENQRLIENNPHKPMKKQMFE